MNSITLAIEVFESKATEIHLAYANKIKTNVCISLEAIEERDEQISKCLWAIETLHAAHIDQKVTGKLAYHSKKVQIDSGLLKI